MLYFQLAEPVVCHQLRKPDTHRILARGELAELARPADDPVPGPTDADDRRRRPADVPARGARWVQLRQRHIRHKRGGQGPVQWQERSAHRPLRVRISKRKTISDPY